MITKSTSQKYPSDINKLKKELRLGIIQQWRDKGMSREEAVNLMNEILEYDNDNV